MRKFLSISFGLLIVLGATFGPVQASEQVVEDQQSTGNIYYVDADASGDADGSNWANAYPYLRDALAVVIPNDQIWVAEGVYYPDDGVGQNNNRESTFELIQNVALYGGFDPGSGVDAFDERDWDAHPTVLSGDIDHEKKPDKTDSRGVVIDTDNIKGKNACNVVSSFDLDETARLDGFIITAGLAEGSGRGCPSRRGNPNIGDPKGAGMYTYNSNPTLENVIFSGNMGGGGEDQGSQGGGMYNVGMNSSDSTLNSYPTLVNVIFSNNSADEGGGMANYFSDPILENVTFSGNVARRGSGGGIRNDFESHPTLINVTFSNNKASIDGGGIYNHTSNPTLTDVTFSGNEAGYSGGGMYNFDSDPNLTDVIFSGNEAVSYDGGGMVNFMGSSPFLTDVTFSGNKAGYSGGGIANDGNPTLMNVIFSNNSAREGGGMTNCFSSPYLANVTFSGNSASSEGGGMYNYNSLVVLVNTILWGNTADASGAQIHNSGGVMPIIAYSNIEGCGGSGAWVADCGNNWGGNINVDPLFESDPGDLHLQDGSPSIDSGINSECPDTDLDGRQRPINGICDMGAYEK